MFEIVTKNERYRVNDAGEISRQCLNWKFSGQWKAVALVRLCNFGVLEVIPFSKWASDLDSIQWLFKNGKPRYTLRDMDHGTMREWSNLVQLVRRIEP